MNTEALTMVTMDVEGWTMAESFGKANNTPIIQKKWIGIKNKQLRVAKKWVYHFNIICIYIYIYIYVSPMK
jgi:hypothetical protein